MLRTSLAGALALGLVLPAQAQTYRDSGGTIVPGVAIVDPTNGTGPLGTATNPLHTTGGGGGYPSVIYSNQQIASASAVALPSQALTNGIVLTAKSTNTGTIYLGPQGVTTTTGYPLIAGQSISYAVTNLSAIFMIGTNTTDVLAFTGN